MVRNLIRLAGSALLVLTSNTFAASDVQWTYDTTVPTWNNHYSANAVFSWSSNDAATNAGSGSLSIAYAADLVGNQSLIFSGFETNGSALAVNLNNYQSVEFDIFVDPSSAPSASGSLGNLQVHGFNNYNYTAIGQYTVPAAATSSWQHVSLSIPNGVGTQTGPAFILKDWEGSNWPNNPGPVTYYIDNLTFVAKPPVPAVDVQPLNQEVFSGQNVNWQVVASGGEPLAYQWKKGAVAIPDGTNALLTLTNVGAGDSDSYSVVITNSFGSITSSVVTLSVVAPDSAYASAVLASQPVAFYELNETTAPAGNPAAYDHISGFAGIYGSTVSNAFQGVTGPSATDGFPGFSLNNAAVGLPGPGDALGHIAIPALNLNTNTVTIAAWINPSTYAQDGAIFFSRAGGTQCGFVWAGISENLGYNWAGDWNTWSWDYSGITPPTNQWSFVALVVTDTNATVYLMNTNGIATPGVNPFTHVSQPFDGTSYIGWDSYSVNRHFAGQIDAVSIYDRSLTQSELTALYFAATGGGLKIAGLNITWNLGTLVEAASLNGPWTPVSGATSPYTVSPTDPMKFYRLVFP